MVQIIPYSRGFIETFAYLPDCGPARTRNPANSTLLAGHRMQIDQDKKVRYRLAGSVLQHLAICNQTRSQLAVRNILHWHAFI